MKNLFFGLSLLIVFISASAQQVSKGLTAANSTFIGFYEYKPVDYNLNNQKYPLIIFLHGIGERGNGTTELSRVLSNGIPKNINAGHPMRFFWNGKWETFIVLSPQLSSVYGYWQTFYVDELISYAKKNLRVDPDRIFLTGLSLGGGGAWQFASASQSNSLQLAALAPVCGTCAMTNGCNIANANLPVWAFHASDDGTVGVGCTTGAINSIKSCNASVTPYMTIWPTGGHSIWDRAYDTAYNWQNPNMYEWFLGQNRRLPVNVRPLADAGKNIMISTATAQVNLSGALSADADGNIVRYIWKNISGPAAGNFNNPVSMVTKVAGLTLSGTYQYELTVVDDRADIGKDTVTVVVTTSIVPNIPPIAEAGNDQVTMSTSALLNGSASYDPDGIVTGYNWSKLSGPGQYTISNPNLSMPSVYNLVPGTYEFILEATDNGGAKSRDTVTVLEASVQIPVKMLYLKGSSTGNANTLLWATSSEYNNDHFDIESSADGAQFKFIGTIRGSLLSTKTKEYSFTDIPAQSLMYYRLKQVDVDGNFEYSKTIAVTNNNGKMKFTYSPNPLRTTINLTIRDMAKGKIEVMLYSLDGKQVLRQQLFKQQEVLSTTISVQHLKPGIYLMALLSGDGSRAVEKVIKD